MSVIPDSPEYATLTGLVEHYSPSGGEAPAVAWLVERMQNLGYGQAFIDGAGSAVGIMGNGPHQAVLLGHIDTVPGLIPPHIENGNLYGRGAVDAKGPLAAFVDAAARLGAVDGWQMIVIGAVDEERDSTGARYVKDRCQPAFAIIGEPSGWERVTIGYKGCAHAAITAQRLRSHTASGEQSACEAAVAAWQAIEQWAAQFNQQRQRVFDRVLPSLRKMASGDDGFTEWAQLEINTRLPLDLPPQEWYRQISLHLPPQPASASQGAGPETGIEPLGFAIPAYLADKNTPLVRAFLAGIRQTGGKPGFVLKTGTADLNIVAPAWNCPAVAYGPGDSALDHTAEEHLSLEEYSRAVSVLEAVLKTSLTQHEA